MSAVLVLTAATPLIVACSTLYVIESKESIVASQGLSAWITMVYTPCLVGVLALVVTAATHSIQGAAIPRELIPVALFIAATAAFCVPVVTEQKRIANATVPALLLGSYAYYLCLYTIPNISVRLWVWPAVFTKRMILTKTL
jgi:hypothetical protein